MSRKSSKRKRKGLDIQLYKIVDDRSGFLLYSDEVVVDHRGRVTSYNNWDPIHPREYPPPKLTEPDMPLPYVRQFTSVNVCPWDNSEEDDT